MSGTNGFFNLLKPPGLTAHDVVGYARKRLGTKKVGHAGTLDPLAAGVLPVAAGSHTRLLAYLEGGKEYLAEISFGRATTTGDAAGETIEERDASFGASDLEAAFGRFRGEIDQVPPAYSAVHVGGRRAYDLARAGVAVEVPSRRVVIEELELVRFARDAGERPVALLRISCSAGTYIRSLAVDIGAALGVPAHLAFLLRTRAGTFRLADSSLLSDAEWRPTSHAVALAHVPALEISDAEAELIRHGQPIREGTTDGRAVEIDRESGAPCRLVRDRQLVAIGEPRGGAVWPRTVLPKD